MAFGWYPSRSARASAQSRVPESTIERSTIARRAPGRGAASGSTSAPRYRDTQLLVGGPGARGGFGRPTPRRGRSCAATECRQGPPPGLTVVRTTLRPLMGGEVEPRSGHGSAPCSSGSSRRAVEATPGPDPTSGRGLRDLLERSLCAAKKKERRGRNRRGRTAQGRHRHSDGVGDRDATSCKAVDPGSPDVAADAIVSGRELGAAVARIGHRSLRAGREDVGPRRMSLEDVVGCAAQTCG